MHSLYFGLVVHLLLVASSFSSEVKNEKDDKMLIMLEIEPIKSDDRAKRSSAAEGVRQDRQTPEVPQEYLGLLQQLTAQQQQQQQQQASATSQQPQQQLIQQLVVSRDGSRQPTAARYVLTQDGKLVDESSLAAFGSQSFGLPQSFGQPQQLPQGFAQPQQLSQAFAQSPQLQQAFAQPQFFHGFGQPQQLPQDLAQQQQSLQGLTQQQQSLQGLAQQQQTLQGLAQQQLPQGLGLQVYQQNPLQSTQPQQIPAAPTQPVRPGQRPRISEFARQQQRILQEVRDAPLRAQIAGLTIRTPNRPVQPVPTGPNSQSPQVFVPPTGQQQQQQPQQQQQQPQQPQPQQFALPPQYQDPQNPNIVYTPVPVDPQTYQLQLQQQLAAQFGGEVDPRQLYAQAQSPSAVSQQLVYQQPIPQEITQDKIRRPITVLPSPSASQPQAVQQNLPQQYLIETTRPSTPQPPQYASSDVSSQIQQQQPQPQPQPQPQLQLQQQQQLSREQEEVQPSTLLQPVAGRGLFTPIKPSRSSIFVSRSSAPKSVSLTITDDITSEKVPVVRLPSTTGQRPLTKQELDSLVLAGYTVTPVQDPQQIQYIKPKRQPVTEVRRNHVVYENPQDGVQYQYSPGSSDATATIKMKKSAPNSEYFKQLYEAEKDSQSDKQVVPYVLALGKESS